MVRHVIIWTLKDTLSEEEKEAVRRNAKTALEGLRGRIPGLISIRVQADGRLTSSTGDLMLDSLFEDLKALRAYGKHPLHVHAAETFVRPFTAVRACYDYECGEEELS